MPIAPPLPGDLEDLLRRLRLPHIRRLAPEVLATARAQRWEPVEVLRALFGEEVAGRERSALATRRAAAGFPTGKTFAAWQPEAASVPAPTQQALRTQGVLLIGRIRMTANCPAPECRFASSFGVAEPPAHRSCLVLLDAFSMPAIPTPQSCSPTTQPGRR